MGMSVEKILIDCNFLEINFCKFDYTNLDINIIKLIINPIKISIS